MATLCTSARRSYLCAALLAIAAPGCTLMLGDLPPKLKERAPRDATVDSEPDAEAPDDSMQEDAGAEPEEAAVAIDADELDGGPLADAAEPADGADDSCDGGVAWYADEDGDGFGTGEAQVACPKPGGNWARESGDCADDDARVHPRQALYFGTPYMRADGNDSYDYDCSGFEEGNPQQPHLRDGCGLLELAACQGSGYARTTRAGLFLNSVCGSLVIDTCEAKLLAVLLCGATSHTTTEPYLCR